MNENIKDIKKIHRGAITLSDKVRITDPCYDMDVWCAGTLENICPGDFLCTYLYGTVGITDSISRDSVLSIEVRHKDYTIDPTEYVPEITVGVDSGQAGIFDYKEYERICLDANANDLFYDKVCNLTSNEEYIPNKKYVPFEKSEYFIPKYEPLKKIKIEDIEKTISDLTCTIQGHIQNIDNDELLNGLEEQLSLYQLYLSSYHLYQNTHILSQKKILVDIPSANTIDGWGFVSSSGDGDGEYALFVGRNDAGQIVSMKIDYYPDYELLQELKSNEEIER